MTDLSIPADVIERIEAVLIEKWDSSPTDLAVAVLRAAGWPEMVEALEAYLNKDIDGLTADKLNVAALAKAMGEEAA